MSFQYFDPSTAPIDVTCAAPPRRSSALAPLATGTYRNGGKRVFDLALCLVTLPVSLLLIAVLAALIALTGRKPFYAQNRIGQHGRVFRMWKLRSMIHDGDRVLNSHLAAHPDARAEWQRAQKLKNDPRVTVLGALLRKTSLDELPQLWNVLRGEMSLVGPRPMLISQEPLYPGNDYYHLRPGISGNWQVSARNRSTFADRAGFDTAYNAHLSFGEDLSILKATFGAVLRATGQ